MRKPKITEFGDYATWITFEVMGNFQIRLILTNDFDKSAIARLGYTIREGKDAFCYHIKGEGRSYIFLDLNSDEATVAHECWHIIHRIMTWCGVADMDDEVIAYHLDHLVGKVHEFKNAIKSSTEKEASDGKRKRRAGTKKSG
jgi:hypothetical protein